MSITSNLQQAIERAAPILGVSLTANAPRYGWGKKSVGAIVVMADGNEAWLRIQFVERDRLNSRQWSGEVEANSISGVKKPHILRFEDWREGDIAWRATLMDLVTYEPCSSTQELRSSLMLDDQWFLDLKQSLQNLQHVSTRRVCVRQDLVNRRISQTFGSSVDTTVRGWTTCHGDLHWANLTCPQMFILDWEGWGQGPVGLDAAFLLAFSLLSPDMAHRIRREFAQDLNSHDGMLSVLFACAELMRMIDLYDNHPDLKAPLKALAGTTLGEIQV